MNPTALKRYNNSRPSPKISSGMSKDNFSNVALNILKTRNAGIEMQITFDKNLQFDQTKLHLLSDDASFKMHPKYWI